MTTVPLSVCYGGAKPLGPWVRTSNFVPVSDRSVTRGEYEGPKAPYRRLLFSLVAWQQNGRTVRSGRSYLSSLSLGEECSLLDLGPMLVPMSFLFIIVPIPFLVGPFVLSRIPCFVPKRRSQRGVVVSRA